MRTGPTQAASIPAVGGPGLLRPALVLARSHRHVALLGLDPHSSVTAGRGGLDQHQPQPRRRSAGVSKNENLFWLEPGRQRGYKPSQPDAGNQTTRSRRLNREFKTMELSGIINEYKIFCTRPIRRWVKFGADMLILPDGRQILPVVDASGPPEAKVWPGMALAARDIRTKEWVPAKVYLEGLEKADEMLRRWRGALTRWTGRRVAEAIVDGHYVHGTTQRIAVELVLAGYKLESVELSKGRYQKVSESYGTYFHYDKIVVAKSSRCLPRLSGAAPYQSAEMADVFGSSGLADEWAVTGDRVISVTCTQG